MQTTARPRFRQDLLAEVIEDGGQKYIDVADPDGNAIFRFFEVEYAIACGMDGQRDVAGIVKWAQDELGLNASPKEIESVISTLAGLAFIGDDQLVDKAAAKVATQTPAAQAQPAPAGAASQAPANNAAAVQAKPAAKNDDLAPGIVTAKSSQAPAQGKGLDIELGSSGSTAPAAQTREAPVADIALGAPGAAQTKQPPKIPVEDVALGAPGAGAAAAQGQGKKKGDDLAMDLSSEMSVGKGDVKEAVRQSKVMTAVDVPKELLEAEAKVAQPAKAKQETPPAKGAEKKAEAKKEEPKKAEAKKEEPKKAEAKKEEPKKAEAKKEEPKKAPDKQEAKKPVVEKTPEKTPVAPPAPSAGVSPALIVTLIVVIVAAGAFLAYKFVFAKEDVPAKTPPAAAKPPEPAPPATATAKVMLETPTAMEIKAGVAGAIETIQPVGTDVKAGDTIATLAGAKPLETQLATIDKQLETLKAPIAAAEEKLKEEQGKEDNAAAAQAAQKRVDDLKKPLTAKETERKTKQEALDKLAIKANADGKLAAPGETEIKAGDKVTADQVIAKIEAPAVATANFKVPAGVKLGDSLEVKAGDKSVTCTISDAQSESVKVACPADSGLADGADVTVTFPAAK